MINLLNPSFLKVLTALDGTSTSMIPVFTRDAVDIGGRLYNGYKRDPIEGKEIAIEEGFATIIWAFGINTAKKIYDWVITKVKSSGILLPGFDINLLEKGPQQLTPELLAHRNAYILDKNGRISSELKTHLENQLVMPQARKDSLKAIQEALHKEFGPTLSTEIQSTLSKLHAEEQQTVQAGIIELESLSQSTLKKMEKELTGHLQTLKSPVGKGLVKQYQNNLTRKFLLTTVPLVLLIAFVLPPIKQWATRMAIQHRKAKEHPNALPQQNGLAQSQNAFYPSPSTSLFSQLRQPNVFSKFSPMSNPYAPTTYPSQGYQQPYFGSAFSEVTQKILSSDQFGSLFVDGTLVTGRTYSAFSRNKFDGIETLFQELCMIYFLFFAATPIQNFFQRLFDKNFKLSTAIEFQSLKHLKEQCEQGKLFQQVDDLQETLQKMSKEHQFAFKDVSHWSKPERKALLNAFEEFVANAANHYTLDGKQGENLLFDMARETGYIPTKTIKGSNQVIRDLTQRIDTDKMYTLLYKLRTFMERTEQRHQALLNALAEKISMAEGQGQTHLVETLTKELNHLKATKAEFFQKTLKQSYKGRSAALLLSLITCSVFLGWIVPKTKQLITRKLTGAHQFPGTLNDGKRVGIFASKADKTPQPQSNPSASQQTQAAQPNSFNPIPQQASFYTPQPRFS